MQKVLSILVVAGALFAQACDRNKGTASSAPSGAPAGAQLQIAVIPKGMTHVYWKSVKAGAEKAAAESNAKILWKGPLQESDRSAQGEIVEEFISDKVDAIVLAPLDDTALVKPVQEATAQKIPVIIIDSSLKGEVGKDFVSYVATDNHHGGELAGQQMVSLLNGKGKIVLLRYMVGSASTEQREAGFLDVIHKNPDMTLLVDNVYGGATAPDSQTAANNMLDQIKQADGIFCPNESSTDGMLQALKQAGIAGKMKFVGFDSSPKLVDALKEGNIDALVAQDPTKMGYEGVKAAIQAIKGQTVPQHIDTGVHVITKATLNDPEIQKLLTP